MKLHFDSCFPREKVIKISPYLPLVYGELNRLAKWRKGKWPTRVHCMSHSEVINGRSKGAGHGYVRPARPSDGIFMNAHMTPQGYLLVLIHENCHVGWPDMTEDEINCKTLPHIWKKVTGKKLTPEYARRYGVGSPAPGVGDRSYCR